MKNIYFVRHGESEGNVSIIAQDASSPLTEKGRKQARFISERCSKLPVDIILSSTMQRAKETAKTIAERIDKPVEYSDLFIERRRPKEQRGKMKSGPEFLRADETIIKNFSTSGWRLSDEENFDDLKTRAGEALKSLAAREENNVLVVTHGFILRVVLAHAIFGEKLTGDICSRFISAFHMENTGITILGYDKKNLESPWWLWVWNDHAHLGEIK